ncbi:MAG: GGDEF domain-containing protein [Comamonas sp.]
MTPATEPPSQTARIRRWLLSNDPHIRTHTAMSGLALVLMAGCVGVLLWLALHGHAPLSWVLTWSGVSLGGLLAATVAIRLGWTRRLSDPSLTLPQMLWAITSAAVAYLVAADARDMLPCMVAMVLLFGSLGLRMRQIVGITLYAFVATSTAMVLTPQLLDQPVSVVDAAHGMMLAVVLLACMAVSLRLHSLRSRLQQQRLALSRALEEHRTLASRDALTGLLNRRSMLELLELEQRRCARGQRNMALAVLDIDHFKRINDNHGHAVGDRALQAFAHTVRHTVRGGDVLARWGGEEFVLLLGDVDACAAHSLLQRIGQAVSQAVVTDAPEDLRMTVSTGLTLHIPGESVDATLERADQALYRAKHQGRNCVVLADLQAASSLPPPPPPPLAPAGLEPCVTAALPATVAAPHPATALL